MSYDFYLFRPVAGEDPLTTGRAQGEEREEPDSPDPDAVQIKRSIAAALNAQNPRLEAHKYDYAELGRSLGISVDEAQRLYQDIELNHLKYGIQVTLSDHSASITVAYWHSDRTIAKAVIAEIWDYLRTINREAAFLVYDPQLDRLLDLSEDYEAVTSTYLQVASRMPEIIGSAAPTNKPWWKLS
jgi:hypothetical protein